MPSGRGGGGGGGQVSGYTRRGRSFKRFQRELPLARVAIEKVLTGRSAAVAGAASLEVAVATAKAVGASLDAFLTHVREVWANPLPPVAATVGREGEEEDDAGGGGGGETLQ